MITEVMEIHYPSFLVLFFSSLILFELMVYLLKSNNIISTPNLPPGPWKLPLIGNLHNLMGSLPHHALRQLALKHGPLMYLQLGKVPVIVVSSADTAKQVMKTHDLNFASRPPNLAMEIMGYKCTNIAFSPYGDYWRQLRKICTMELLSVKRVESLRWLREDVFLDLGRWISSMEGSPFNLTEKLTASTYALIARAAVGNVAEEQRRVVPILHEVIPYAAGFNIVELYPSLMVFRRMTTVWRRLSILHEELDKIFEDIISQHKVANSNGEKKQEDLLDVLLKYQDDGLELPLTNDNVKAALSDILSGGTDTAATTMTWAMAEMLKNPKILKRAQLEVREVFDRKGSCVDESSIHELKYLKAVIKETLRLHPPVPLLVPRLCGDTCEINGYQIPSNTKIIINAWAINRDSNNWKDGECFQPERFFDTEVDFRGNHFEFIPFGAGRRICPGISFGLATVELSLAMLLYHFDWGLPAGKSNQDMEMEEAFGVTASRAKDLFLVPVTKRPLPLPIK